MSSSFKAILAGSLFLGLTGQAGATLDEVAQALAAADHVRAVALLQAEPPAERDSFRGRLLYASALAGQGRQDEASAVYRELIATAPGEPEPYNNLAVLYAAEGRLDEALALLEQAMNTSASYAAIRANLGKIYLEKSLNSYAKALRVEEPEDTLRLQVLYRPAGPSQPSAPVVMARADDLPAAVEVVVNGDVQAQPVAEAPTVEGMASSVPTVAATAPEKPVAAPAPEAVPAETDDGTAAEEVVSAAEPPPVPQADAGSQQAIVSAVHGWAKAWQGQDVETYLGAYADDFEPPLGLDVTAWKAQRRQRLKKPEQIEVALEDIAVTFRGREYARVTFLQRYRSDRYRDTTRKRLGMVWQDNAWKIRTEKTLEVIKE